MIYISKKTVKLIHLNIKLLNLLEIWFNKETVFKIIFLKMIE